MALPFILTVLCIQCIIPVVEMGPWHASCKIDWTFGMACDGVSNKLVAQIKAWEGPIGCEHGGEKCLYELTDVTAEKLTATHTTPKAGYVDDLTFSFTNTDAACNIHGYSTSESWYAVLDKGTNYCNLHNLIIGSGLNNSEGYTEKTSNSICTQYSSADCDIY